MEAGDTESSAVEDSDVIEIVPSEDYDIGKVSQKEILKKKNRRIRIYRIY